MLTVSRDTVVASSRCQSHTPQASCQAFSNLVCLRGACRLHHQFSDYRSSISEVMDRYNDERPRMPYLMWMVRLQPLPNLFNDMRYL